MLGILIASAVPATGMRGAFDRMLGPVAHLNVTQVAAGHRLDLSDCLPLACRLTRQVDASLVVARLHFFEGILQSDSGLPESCWCL